jgi:hypothetical protein
MGAKNSIKIVDSQDSRYHFGGGGMKECRMSNNKVRCFAALSMTKYAIRFTNHNRGYFLPGFGAEGGCPRGLRDLRLSIFRSAG